MQMLQASFADDDAAARTGYVEEEIERALREVPAARRGAALRGRRTKGNGPPPCFVVKPEEMVRKRACLKQAWRGRGFFILAML